LLTAGGGETRIVLGRVLARVDTLVGRTTARSGTVGRALSDPSLYANADSVVRELRALVADVKARRTR
jgi:phospholipid/cholesterol/gamma-HCH transport system substrate-binding protein